MPGSQEHPVWSDTRKRPRLAGACEQDRQWCEMKSEGQAGWTVVVGAVGAHQGDILHQSVVPKPCSWGCWEGMCSRSRGQRDRETPPDNTRW